ncbi:2Fe-2S iron-sulfur cluster-binding protein, partial [Sulfitobacter sp.]|uniref:2Fe-2S iron-sulfur cluster-binding protein n=1 Tax=Sulfitobacter sp. TaxID=1903071 RepID=UPI0030028F60
VATRYDRCPKVFLSAIALAATVIFWLCVLSLASALLANDVRLMGRSFKYHRPRGPRTAGSEEFSAFVEMREGARCEPNTRATVIGA